jgi:hypothetical protein
MGAGMSSSVVKLAEREADHTGVDVQSFTSTSPYVCMAWFESGGSILLFFLGRLNWIGGLDGFQNRCGREQNNPV